MNCVASSGVTCLALSPIALERPGPSPCAGDNVKEQETSDVRLQPTLINKPPPSPCMLALIPPLSLLPPLHSTSAHSNTLTPTGRPGSYSEPCGRQGSLCVVLPFALLLLLLLLHNGELGWPCGPCFCWSLVSMIMAAPTYAMAMHCCCSLLGAGCGNVTPNIFLSSNVF